MDCGIHWQRQIKNLTTSGNYGITQLDLNHVNYLENIKDASNVIG